MPAAERLPRQSERQRAATEKPLAPPAPFLRRGGAPQPRNRRRQIWRRALGLAGNFLLATGLVGGAAWGVWSLTHAPRFAWRRLALSGTARSDAAALTRALDPWRGTNVFLLDAAALRTRLRQEPWVADVEVRKRIPDALEVVVHEKTAAALLRRDDRLWFVGRDGTVVAPLGPGDGETDLVLLEAESGEPTPAAIAAAIRFVETLATERPDLARRLSRVGLAGGDALVLEEERAGAPRLLADPATFAARYSFYLKRVAPRLGGQPLVAIDLRFRGRVIVTPASLPPAAAPQGEI